MYSEKLILTKLLLHTTRIWYAMSFLCDMIPLMHHKFDSFSHFTFSTFKNILYFFVSYNYTLLFSTFLPNIWYRIYILNLKSWLFSPYSILNSQQLSLQNVFPRWINNISIIIYNILWLKIYINQDFKSILTVSLGANGENFQSSMWNFDLKPNGARALEET